MEAQVAAVGGGVGEEAEPIEEDGVAARAGEEAEDGVVDDPRVAVVRAAARPVEELEAEQQQCVGVAEPPRAVAEHGEDELLRERERLERVRLIGRERLVDRIERLGRRRRGRGRGAAGLEEPDVEGGGDGGRGRGYEAGVLGARRKQRREWRERRRERGRRGGGRREGVRENGEEGPREVEAELAAGAAGERGEEDAGHGEASGGQRRGRGRRQQWRPAAVGGICGVRAEWRGGGGGGKAPARYGQGRRGLGRCWVMGRRGGVLWAECLFGSAWLRSFRSCFFPSFIYFIHTYLYYHHS